jgi:hypothetical protein
LIDLIRHAVHPSTAIQRQAGKYRGELFLLARDRKAAHTATITGRSEPVRRWWLRETCAPACESKERALSSERSSNDTNDRESLRASVKEAIHISRRLKEERKQRMKSWLQWRQRRDVVQFRGDDGSRLW